MTEKGIVEQELYFLITKFLESGPYVAVAKTLRDEIKRRNVLFRRRDWTGRIHERSLDDFENINRHVHPDFLLGLLSQLRAQCDRLSASNVHSVKSLLCRGQLSLLQDEFGAYAPDTTAKYAAVFHCKPKVFPLSHKQSSFVPIISARSWTGTGSTSPFTIKSFLYSKMAMHKRILGHLASVYCILFDRTGSVIITGADDQLVKLWCAEDGRLLATLRGHCGEITDITVNMENTLVASGSLDKTIRVWDLHTTQPVAVLQGHTGMITSVKFCPNGEEHYRYLMSTGGDGSVCFWKWSGKKNEFSLTPIKFNEKSRPGVQMLCSSFSPGGCFVACGSSDNYIRVYQIMPGPPEKIAELQNHSDHVDSIQYSFMGDRFLSGSPDGCAMIWSFRQGEWKSLLLKVTLEAQGQPELSEEEMKRFKLKVTMIAWNCNDQFVITAVNDKSLRVWNSYSAEVTHVLRQHSEEIFVLEAHPLEPQLILSAGHDGNIILWDIYTGSAVKTFCNLLDEQGQGAIFDSRFSPTGMQFAATDSHGHLLIFGFGSDHAYRRVPFEQFFHTDYRPVIRDANNYVLDEQTQTAPHLMPPPFLVDIDGNPHSVDYQVLIPGRTAANLPHRRFEPLQLLDNEDLPPFLAEIQAAEAVAAGIQSAQQNLMSPSGRSRSEENALASPVNVGRLGLRESGDVEGVRQQSSYVSGDISAADLESWRRRVIVRKSTLFNPSEDESRHIAKGKEELKSYINERKWRSRKSSVDDSKVKLTARACAMRSRTGKRGPSRVLYVRASALACNPWLQAVSNQQQASENASESEPEDWQGESSDSSDSDWVDESTTKKEKKEKKKVKDDEEEDQIEGKSKSSSKRRIKQIATSDEESVAATDAESSAESSSSSASEECASDSDSRSSSDSSVDEGAGARRTSRHRKQLKLNQVNDRGKQRAPKKHEQPLTKEDKKARKEKAKLRPVTKVPIPLLASREEFLDYFRPPDWLLLAEPKKFPYFPQIGDEVYYLRQSHALYVKEVIRRNIYKINEHRQAYLRYDLAPEELCKLVGISYDVGPPRICSLKLEVLSKKKSSGGRRNICVRFHDMPDVVDFIVLKYYYDMAIQRNWKVGDRFRAVIEDSWWYGTILDKSPFSRDFPDSFFQCYIVRWDTNEQERMSPWDFEEIPPNEDVQGSAECVPLSETEKRALEYQPTGAEWPGESMERLASRTCSALDEFVQLETVEPFAMPVDVEQYPTYWQHISFPTDLSTIRTRLANRFYRRRDAVLWELRQLRANAIKFNLPGSVIACSASCIVKALTKFIRDPSCTDLLQLYDDLMFDDQVQGLEDESMPSESDSEAEQGPSTSTSASQVAVENGQSWLSLAADLVEFINSREDSQPFREPVNLEDYPDYLELVAEPIDISVIRQRLVSNQYDDPNAFIRDFKLMFDNSKAYNTNKRSRIYGMTVRLFALFKERCASILQAWEKVSRAACTTRRSNRHRTPNPALQDGGKLSYEQVVDARVRHEHPNSDRHKKTSPSRTSATPGSSASCNGSDSASLNSRSNDVTRVRRRNYRLSSKESSERACEAKNSGKRAKTRKKFILRERESSCDTREAEEEGVSDLSVASAPSEASDFECEKVNMPKHSRTLSPRKSARPVRSSQRARRKRKLSLNSESEDGQNSVAPKVSTVQASKLNANKSTPSGQSRTKPSVRVVNGVAKGEAKTSRYPRSKRVRAAVVNYCEDYDDEVIEETPEYEAEDEETSTKLDYKTSSEVSEEVDDSSASDDDSSDDSDESDKRPSTAAAISSRGRQIRPVKFVDYVE